MLSFLSTLTTFETGDLPTVSVGRPPQLVQEAVNMVWCGSYRWRRTALLQPTAITVADPGLDVFVANTDEGLPGSHITLRQSPTSTLIRQQPQIAV